MWRFGSLANAYVLIGEVGRAPHIRLGRHKCRRLRLPIVDAVVRSLHEDGRSAIVHDYGCRIRIDNRWDCRLQIVSRRTDRAKTPRWCVRLREQSAADFYLLARESTNQETIMDYYVVPAVVGRTFPTVLKFRNGAEIDRFRLRELRAAIETLVTFLFRRNERASMRAIELSPGAPVRYS